MENGPKPSSQRAGALQKPTVLIVEDDFATRRTAAEYLRQAGYRVIEAENVAESTSVLSSGTHVDFVFSDINMPGAVNGLGFAQWLATHHPTIPMLLTSGVLREATVIATEGKLRRFVAKPYDLDEVDRQIKEML